MLDAKTDTMDEETTQVLNTVAAHVKLQEASTLGLRS